MPQAGDLSFSNLKLLTSWASVQGKTIDLKICSSAYWMKDLCHEGHARDFAPCLPRTKSLPQIDCRLSPKPVGPLCPTKINVWLSGWSWISLLILSAESSVSCTRYIFDIKLGAVLLPYSLSSFVSLNVHIITRSSAIAFWAYRRALSGWPILLLNRLSCYKESTFPL